MVKGVGLGPQRWLSGFSDMVRITRLAVSRLAEGFGYFFPNFRKIPFLQCNELNMYIVLTFLS